MKLFLSSLYARGPFNNTQSKLSNNFTREVPSDAFMNILTLNKALSRKEPFCTCDDFAHSNGVASNMNGKPAIQLLALVAIGIQFERRNKLSKLV